MSADPVIGENVSVKTIDGDDRFEAYLARPQKGSRFGILILQEIFGITHRIRSYCDLFAWHGYFAIAPDLYWRQQPGVQLTRSPDGIAQALELLRGLDMTLALSDIKATAGLLNSLGVEAYGSVGFCLGGRLAMRLLADGFGEAAISFYGMGLDQEDDRIAALGRPAQFHFGEADDHISPSIVRNIVHMAATNKNLEVHSYAGAGHGFFRGGLDDEASRIAFDRARTLLDRALGTGAER